MLEFLDTLRETNVCNMFGAGPYLRAEFPELGRPDAGSIVIYWMRTYGKGKR
jgi:hypothetical protein